MNTPFARSLVLIIPSLTMTAAPALADGDCGSHLRPVEALRAAALQRAGAYKLPGGIAGDKSYIVPVTFHIVRASDGTGGMDPSIVPTMIADANAAFSGAGMSFCQFGEIWFIDDDHYLTEVDTMEEIDDLRTTDVVKNTMNMYFVDDLGSLCGISSFTFSDVQGIVCRNSCTPAGDNHSTVTHEIGHYFDLYHTHETYLGEECVDGSNCDTAGDLLCDTPADPMLLDEVDRACNYVGGATDPCDGSPYQPDTSNHMSYALAICRDYLSPQQWERARATLVNLRPELAKSECPGVPPPLLGDMQRWSVTSEAAQAEGSSFFAAMAADLSAVAFSSNAPNLVEDDSNRVYDIFVRDLRNGEVERVSVSSSGVEAIDSSFSPALSADGRYVAFHSLAPNLMGFPFQPSHNKVFLHDRADHETELVSSTSSGVVNNNDAINPAISSDGRYIAFCSRAGNLSPIDFNSTWDIFLKDRVTESVELISVALDGQSGNFASGSNTERVVMTPDARYIAFTSMANNLVSGDGNGLRDIFVRDRLTDVTHRVNLSSAGMEADAFAARPTISNDGRYIAFVSAATNLVLDDGNELSDIFVRDMVTLTTTRASVSSSGSELNGDSTTPSFSADGRMLAFQSRATNIVPYDTDTVADTYLCDLTNKTVNLASPRMVPEGSAGDALEPRVSADGTTIAFHSVAGNLVPDDTNEMSDVFAFKPFAAGIPEDLNHDGIVSGLDLAILLGQWGPCDVPGPVSCPADLNHDGIVSGLDLAILLVVWT